MKTAPQILEHYTQIDWKELHSFWWVLKDDILKAMRHYARVKSEKQKFNFAWTYKGRDVFIDWTPEEAKWLINYMYAQQKEIIQAQKIITERQVELIRLNNIPQRKKSLFSKLFW